MIVHEEWTIVHMVIFVKLKEAFVRLVDFTYFCKLKPNNELEGLWAQSKSGKGGLDHQESPHHTKI